jgi:hypothetical protein
LTTNDIASSDKQRTSWLVDRGTRRGIPKYAFHPSFLRSGTTEPSPTLLPHSILHVDTKRLLSYQRMDTNPWKTCPVSLSASIRMDARRRDSSPSYKSPSNPSIRMGSISHLRRFYSIPLCCCRSCALPFAFSFPQPSALSLSILGWLVSNL